MARGIPVVFVVVVYVVVLLWCLSLGYARCSFYPCCPAFLTRPIHPLALFPCPLIIILLIGALIPPTPAVPPLARPLRLAPSPLPSSSISSLPSEPCLEMVIFLARFVVSFVVLFVVQNAPRTDWAPPSYRLGPPSYRLGPPSYRLGPPLVPIGPPWDHKMTTNVAPQNNHKITPKLYIFAVATAQAECRHACIRRHGELWLAGRLLVRC
jgi:hypothetical protein